MNSVPNPLAGTPKRVNPHVPNFETWDWLEGRCKRLTTDNVVRFRQEYQLDPPPTPEPKLPEFRFKLPTLRALGELTARDPANAWHQRVAVEREEALSDLITHYGMSIDRPEEIRTRCRIEHHVAEGREVVFVDDQPRLEMGWVKAHGLRAQWTAIHIQDHETQDEDPTPHHSEPQA